MLNVVSYLAEHAVRVTVFGKLEFGARVSMCCIAWADHDIALKYVYVASVQYEVDCLFG